MKHHFIIGLLALFLISCSSELNKKVVIHPISHGSLVIEYGQDMIYIDPVGKNEDFIGLKKPSIILITDIHGDHLNLETLQEISDSTLTLVVPDAVSKRLNNSIKGNIMVMNNGDVKTFDGIKIEAIPMYNLREEALKFHEKGRGNGYLITLGKERIYISGDTEDVPEMRALKNIDMAFVCMNLPWTMTVDKAADAVLEFKPKEVYPYHYRGTEGLSDIESFKSMVNSKNNKIKVTLLDWYKE